MDGAGSEPPREPEEGDAVQLVIPDPAVVLLVGVAGCGKSTFASRHFRSTEVLSSDHLRAVVSGEPDDQAASADAFAALRFLLDKRSKRGLLSVVDATNLERGHRRQLISIARDHGLPVVAILLDVEMEVCRVRNASREGRTVPEDVLEDQRAAFERSRRQIRDEDIEVAHILASAAQVARAQIARTRSREEPS